jgi:peptidoglycan/LPS O-acetylase OafA/YrhL
MFWHVAFVFPFQTDQMNPVIWSLLYEMRISLLFPLVMYAFGRVSTLTVVASAAVASAVVCGYAVSIDHPVIQASVTGEWLPTVHYMLMFVVGAALAKHRAQIQRFVSGGPRAFQLGAALTIGSALLYVGSRPVSMIASGVLSDYVFDWIALIAVAGIISAALSFMPLIRVLQSRPVLFLGRISFSLYLYHAIVLFSVVHLMDGRETMNQALVMAECLIVPVSYLAYRLVERPGMRVGGMLAKRMAARQEQRKLRAS